MNYDHILIVGFGGPEKPQDLDPFLAEVTRGLPIPAERIAQVKRHYEAVGGRSPYNDCTFRLFDAISAQLQARGIGLPVFLGMRNWHPFLKHTLQEIKREALKRGIGVILAPHRSDNSFQKYQRNVADSKAFAQAVDITYDYLPAWFNHPKFIEAQAHCVQEALQALQPQGRSDSAALVFCAHSIPEAMAQRCRYVEEFECSSRLVAQQLGYERWHLAYQSRSGSPREPWLEPSIEQMLQRLHSQGARQAVVVPIGFLCDNVEVLFDLDVEAKAEAEKLGLEFVRASTVIDHPVFAGMFTDLIGGMIRLPLNIPLGVGQDALKERPVPSR
jgi:ferrochelatase